MEQAMILSKNDYIFPQQPYQSGNTIKNLSIIPKGKMKIIVYNIKTESNTFSISINFLTKKNHGDFSNKETLSVVTENAVKIFPNGSGYAYIDNKENRDIDLKYNDDGYFDYYYIVLNPSTVNTEDSVTFKIDFI